MQLESIANDTSVDDVTPVIGDETTPESISPVESPPELPTESLPERLRSTLYRAIDVGRVEGTRKICKQIPEKTGLSLADDMFKHPETGVNVLHYAINKNCKMQVVKMLLESCKPDLILQTQDEEVAAITTKKTILHKLAFKGELNLIKVTLDKLPGGEIENDFLEQTVLTEMEGQRPRPMNCMHIAALMGHSEVLDYLVLIGMDVNIVNNKGDTPLMWAVKNKHAGAVRKLIKLCADVNQENDKGSTPLYWACRYGHVEIVKILIQEGKADIHHRRKLGLVSPIVLAAALGHSKIVSVLIEHGAEINLSIQGGYTPLHYAASQGNADTVKLLILLGANIHAETDFGETPLLLAAAGDEAETVEVLASEGASLDCMNKAGRTVWHFAIDAESSQLLETLVHIYRSLRRVSGGKIIFPVGKTALHIATLKEDIDKLQKLLDLGADPSAVDSNGNTFLHIAAKEDCTAVISVFLGQANVNAQNSVGNTALHLAAHYGKIEAVNQLLKRVQVDLKNDTDETALHVACKSYMSEPDVVKLIVDTIIKAHNWSLIDAADIDGNSALHIAAQHGRDDLLDYLKPLNPRLINKNGDSPLHIAAKAGRRELLEEMFEVFNIGININQENNKHETVLHIAMNNLDIELVEIVLSAGSDLEVQDNRGNTALHILAKKATPDSEMNGKCMPLFDAVMDNAVSWYCRKNKLQVPESGTDIYISYQRRSVTYLTSEIPNKQGLSVLLLCTKLGCKTMLETILQSPGVYFFYEDSQYVFDVTSLIPETTLTNAGDDLKNRSVVGIYKKMYVSIQDENGSGLRISCLDLIVQAKDIQTANTMLDIVPIKQLVIDYWAVYQGLYGFLMFIHIFYMSFLSGYGIPLISYVYLSDNSNSNTNDTSTAEDITTFPSGFFLLWPIILLIFELYYVIINAYIWSMKRQMVDPLKAKNRSCVRSLHSAYLTITEHFSHITCVIFCLLIFIWFGLYSANSVSQVPVIATTFVIGWLFTIVFTKGFQSVHAYSIMIKNIILTDISRFFFIYLFVLFAFSFAFQALFWLSPTYSERYPTAWHFFLLVFNVMIGVEEMFGEGFDEEFEQLGISSIGVYARVLYVLYTSISTIILFNLLIAMMTDTYADVRKKEDTSWRISSLQLAMHIEKSMPFIPHFFKAIGIKRNPLAFDSNTSRWLFYISQSEVQLNSTNKNDEVINTLGRLKMDLSTLHSGMSLMNDKLELLAQQSVLPMLDTSIRPRPAARFKELTPRTSTPKNQDRRVTFSELPTVDIELS